MMLHRLLVLIFLAIPASLLPLKTLAEESGLEAVLYPVALRPEPRNGERPITVPDERQCKVHNHDGCLRFAPNKIGVIEFYLPGPKHKERCSDLPSERARRVITKVELSTTPRDGDQTKGNFNAEVASWLKEDAFPNLNLTDGVVYRADISTGTTSVLLLNTNSHQHEDDPIKSFWYKVVVTDCDEPDRQWVFDPRGDNEGLN